MKKGNLTRKDLADAVADQLGFARTTCADIVDSFFDSMKQTTTQWKKSENRRIYLDKKTSDGKF